MRSTHKQDLDPKDSVARELFCPNLREWEYHELYEGYNAVTFLNFSSDGKHGTVLVLEQKRDVGIIVFLPSC